MFARVLPLLVLAVFAAGTLRAQDRAKRDSTHKGVGLAPPVAGAPGPEQVTQTSDAAGDHPTLAVAPIPSYNPQFEFGVALAAMVFHRLDSDSSTPASIGMALGYASANGTWGAAAIEVAHLDGDAWRVVGGVGYFKLFYDFYGFGTDAGNEGAAVTLRQPVAFGAAQVLRRITTGLYLGGRIIYASSNFSFKDETLPPALAGLAGLNKTVNSLGFAPVAQLDLRDDQYYPTRGWYGSLGTTMAFAGVGSDSTFQRTYGFASHYHRWTEGRDVLAVGADGCYASGAVSISQYCMIGDLRGIRGYQPGRYVDLFEIGAQAEYRRRLGGRLGLTVFGGISGVAPSPGALSTDDLKSAAGLGLRFRLTKKYALNYRVDVTYGSDGVQLFVALAEAF